MIDNKIQSLLDIFPGTEDVVLSDLRDSLERHVTCALDEWVRAEARTLEKTVKSTLKGALKEELEKQLLDKKDEIIQKLVQKKIKELLK